MKRTIVCLFLLVLTLTACSGTAQPTLTPVPSPTLAVVPTRTATLAPTDMPLTATPATISEWQGIPIMPGAVTGDGDEEGYVFTIRATPRQIREYYELELGKLGWQSSVEEEGATSLVLTFTNASSEILTVSILTKGEEALVLLTK